ncbi:hypothetical protein POX_f08246 [Penicillium oxalicum]|uniref:Uncharacterized protein n=1 Tax=Penicillium oxalicum (strain 114-2 / CGMCC 5302) TaxID=933388 RepID=S7ZEV3_PENO1|nr:hypothetical protein POX_f08246 [Penicillium oxalicum]EPS29200.1 hypothetical protein PDE_04149 [Penicillium oxalicum 114-2]KAI2787866.1 hypothetical protein POX_f08246 [Penicillium oxalicum]
MKSEIFFGTLASLAVASAASPLITRSERITLKGDQLNGMRDVLRANGMADVLAANQNIQCTITYSLALSTEAPWTITLATLNLENCQFTA